jgi:hypothetical protein
VVVVLGVEEQEIWPIETQALELLDKEIMVEVVFMVHPTVAEAAEVLEVLVVMVVLAMEVLVALDHFHILHGQQQLLLA